MILDVFDKNFRRIENISRYSCVKYTKELNGAGSFEVYISLDDMGRDIIQNGVYILFERDILGVIQFLNPSVDQQTGKDEIEIKGRLAHTILSRRCIPSTQSYSGTVTQVVRALVDANCITPEDTKRALPLILSTDPQFIPSASNISIQATGDTVQEKIESLLDAEEMGYDVVPILTSNAISGFEFRVIGGIDHSIGNTAGNPAVLFSEDLKNVLSSEYEYNSTDYKNMAYVAGEGENSDRVIIETGDTAKEGLERYELYVDARDLQSTDENEQQLTPEEYEELLEGRGAEKLGECYISETYEASINQETQFVYGQDYTLGDIVTIRDSHLGVDLNAKVTQVDVTSMGEQDLFDVTFGYYKLTTAQKLRRGGIV